MPNGEKYINYWDNIHGNDINCQIIDGKLFISEYNEKGNELSNKEISFLEFINLVKVQPKKLAHSFNFG